MSTRIGNLELLFQAGSVGKPACPRPPGAEPGNTVVDPGWVSYGCSAL